MSGHAILSPSTGDRWLTGGCTGSPALNYGGGDDWNEYADEGTAAHYLLEWCLVNEKDAADFPDAVIHVLSNGDAWSDLLADNEPSRNPIRSSFDCDEDMRDHIQVVVDDIRRCAKGNEIIAEQRVYFANTLSVPEEFGSGTADARVRDHAEKCLQVHDLKYGASPRGIVHAGTSEKPNPQLGLYGVGSLEEDELLDDWEYVELHVHQPRLNHKDVVRVSIADMKAFAQSARARAAEALQSFMHDDEGNLVRTKEGALVPRKMEELDAQGMLQPSEKGCYYCAVADSCFALRRKNLQTAMDHFEVLELDEPRHETEKKLEAAFARAFPLPGELDLLETFIEAVRTKVKSRLKSGDKIPGWKLVMGRKGKRSWVKAALSKVEELMRSKFRLKAEQMYTRKLISPKGAETLLKDQPKRWQQLQEFITQSDGSESLAPDSDPRKAVEHKPVRDQFDDVGADDLI